MIANSVGLSLKLVGGASAAIVVLSWLSACQPATPESTPEPVTPSPQASSLDVLTTPSLVSVESNGNWSAAVALEVSGGQPPYTYETEWPRAGDDEPATYDVRASGCKPVRFIALVKSADGQQREVNIQFGPSTCDTLVAQAPAATPTLSLTPTAGGATTPVASVTPTASVAPTATARPATSTPRATTTPSSAAQDLFNRINPLRAENGLAALKLNDQLTAAAVRHSQDMANTGTVSHAGSDGSSSSQRAQEAGYTWPTGENVYGGSVTVDDVWDFWSTDPLHRQNLLNKTTTEIGIGVVTSAKGTYYTAVFGARP